MTVAEGVVADDLPVPEDDGPAESLAPSHNDPTAWRAAGALGGPWGRYAAAGRWWSPLRWVLAMTLATLLLGLAQKAPCANGDWPGQRNYTHVCDSQLVPFWTDARFDIGAVPYRDTTIDLPVLTGGFAYLTADLTRGLHALHDSWSEVVLFGLLSALLLSICALAISACTALTARRRPYDAALFALSPLLAFHAFTSWDLLAMAFASGALLAWARRRPVLAGALIGLGAAAKVYPVVLLAAIWILAIRTRKRGDARWATLSAAVVWLAVNAPLALAYHSSWWHFYRSSVDADAERSSIWAILHSIGAESLADHDASPWAPPGVAVALAVAAGLLCVAYLGLSAPTRPRLAQLAFLCVLVYLLTNKQWSPSESLWLLPLLALARPRWRLSLLWQFSEIAVWIVTMFVLFGDHAASGDFNQGLSYGWLVLFIALRDVALIALGVLVVIEMWHPDLDVVRLRGDDDPGGGVFDGAPDYWSPGGYGGRHVSAESAEVETAVGAPAAATGDGPDQASDDLR